ncbi:hypothetical protein AC26_2454 [Escherichia coli 1-176-05_S3_C2]|nr:hypothetical protein AC26_2454 [Escherichia coli 1-176-05_S3_C2]
MKNKKIRATSSTPFWKKLSLIPLTKYHLQKMRWMLTWIITKFLIC